MQIFTRRKGEEIVLIDKDGTVVTVKLTATNSKEAKIGVSAPLSVRVIQREVYDRERDWKPDNN